MTTCLNTVSYISLQRILKKHGDDYLDETILLNSIGLRMFRPELGNLQLGYCVGMLPWVFHRADHHLDNYDDSSEVARKFWHMAARNQREFAARVLTDNEKFDFAPWKTKPRGEKSIINHIGLSNLGVLDTGDSRPLFDVESQFIVCSYESRVRYQLFFSSICTVDGRVCWSPSFNSHFVDQFVLDEFEQNCRQIIETITAS